MFISEVQQQKLDLELKAEREMAFFQGLPPSEQVRYIPLPNPLSLTPYCLPPSLLIAVS
jgi:hypothetical protein